MATTANALRRCSDCGGSGKYVGLTIVEPCRACEGTGHLGRPRVDVVKKHGIDHYVFRRFLTEQGYDVYCYSNVFDYLDELESAPHAIIAGYFFEHGTLELLLDELDVRSIDVPVIVCTVMDIDRDMLPANVYALFARTAFPFESEEFGETLRRAVAGAPPLIA